MKRSKMCGGRCRSEAKVEMVRTPEMKGSKSETL